MINDLLIKDFPQLSKEKIYFDSAATSLKPRLVIEAVDYYNNELSANINRGMYKSAIEATNLYEATREEIAKFINASPKEVIYTRGTTSSLNLVAYSYGLNNLHQGDEIIVSELEHHSSFLPWQFVAKKTGAILKFVELDKTGRITINAFKRAISKKTKVVALTYVSNVMGYITPIEDIIKIAHSYNAIVVVDAAQAIPHTKVDVLKLDCDFLAFSGHKMLGPTGIGILYGKQKLLENMEPFEYGGDMNEDVNKDLSTWKPVPQKFEAGTMPIAEVIGLGKAVKYIEKIGVQNIHKYLTDLYKYAILKIKDLEGIKIYNPDSDTGIISFNLENVPSHDAITYYAEENIAIRAGQHCAKLICDWLGIYSCLRVSFYIYNTYEEIDRFVLITKKAISYFKELGF